MARALGPASTLADFSRQRRQGRAGSGERSAPPGSSDSNSTVSFEGTVRVQQGFLGAIHGQWVRCQCSVDEKLTIAHTSAHRVLSSRLQVTAAGLNLINIDGEPQLFLPGLPSVYQRVGSGSDFCAGLLRPLQGVWSGDHAGALLLKTDEKGVVTMEQKLQLESRADLGLLLHGQTLATRRGKLYWHDPFLDEVCSYLRAPDRASFDPRSRLRIRLRAAKALLVLQRCLAPP